METSLVDFSPTEPPRTPALDWKEFFGELVASKLRKTNLK